MEELVAKMEKLRGLSNALDYARKAYLAFRNSSDGMRITTIYMDRVNLWAVMPAIVVYREDGTVEETGRRFGNKWALPGRYYNSLHVVEG